MDEGQASKVKEPNEDVRVSKEAACLARLMSSLDIFVES